MNDTQTLTVRTCLGKAELLAASSDTARLDTEILLAKALEKPRAFLYTWAETVLTSEQATKFNNGFERRLAGEPIAYIIGEQEFWSLSFKVNASTLIPRPETELLVETALALLPATQQRVLDLGTGTGAIALALASERPNWTLLAVDKYPGAVELAIENCTRFDLPNVAINRSDWYSNVGSELFNAIVCNPPYVHGEDKHLQQGDVRFEPQSALVAKNQGLADIAEIIEGSAQHLCSSGWLLVEHGWDQGAMVRAFFQQQNFQAISTKKDLSGNDRITIGQLATSE